MGIVFTRAWEDDRLDLEVLEARVGSRALVVAGAGDTALALAGAGADVVAVDLNPDQLHLAALKLAAAHVLAPARVHAWFEAPSDPGVRREYAEVVRRALAPDEAAFWDTNVALFDRGLHRATGLSRPFIRIGRIVRFVRPGLARFVESVGDLEAQAAYWRRHVRPWLFGPLSHWLIAHGPALRALSPNRNETDRVRHGRWSHGLAERIDGVVGRVLVREHPWWRPLASGRAVDPGHGAAWLDPERAGGLAQGAGHVTWRLADLTSALEAVDAASLDAISVSNVLDWLDAGAELALAGAARRAAAAGGRVLVRHLVRPDGPDPYVAQGLVRDPVSDELPGRDRTALYAAIDLYRAPAARTA